MIKKYKKDIFYAAILLIINFFVLFSGDVFRGEDFFSNYTTAEQKCISEGIEAGCFVYGPYAAYASGSYLINISGDIDSEGSTVDVFSGTTGKIYYQGELSAGRTIKVYLDEDVPDVEIRMFYSGVGFIRLEKVVVRRVHSLFTYMLVLLLDIVLYFLMRYDSRRFDGANVANFFVQIAKLFFASGLIVLTVEYLQEEKMLLVLGRLQSGSAFFFINTGIVFAVLFFLYMMFRSVGAAVLTGAVISCVLTIIEYNYYQLRGEAFQLSEIMLAGEAADVIGGYSVSVPRILPFIVLLMLCLSIVIGFRREKINRSVRVLCSFACMLFFVSIYSNIGEVIEEAGGDPVVYIAKSFYEDYGYILGLVRTAPREPEKPAGYNRENVLAITETREEPKEDAIHPNIIYIQNESLYDMALVTDTIWNEDPLDDLRELQEENTGGYLISPMAGGGTCNVEYEILTAYPYYNTRGTPFTNLIKKGASSIVSILREQGYETEAIHLNRGDFFNRDVVYSNLGFDKIYFSDAVTSHAEEDLFNGWYGDAFLYEEFISEFENRDPDKPYFAHVVTTQNHGGYEWAYDDHGILVDEKAADSDWREIQTFLNLEKESVESLKKLIAYFETQSEPTVIVFWGDHFPGFSQFGISESDSMEFYIKEHLTPLLIWNNYGLEAEAPEMMSAYNISPYILNLTGLSADVYMDYMRSCSVPNVLNEVEIMDENHYRYLQDWDESQRGIWDNIWMLQYDRMFGKKYSEKN